MASDLSTFGNECAVDDFSTFGRDTSEEVGRWRIQAKTLFDAGNEEGEMLASFFVLDGAGEVASFLGGVDFGASTGEGGLVEDKEAQDGSQGCAGGVGSSLDQKSDVGALLNR